MTAAIETRLSRLDDPGFAQTPTCAAGHRWPLRAVVNAGPLINTGNFEGRWTARRTEHLENWSGASPLGGGAEVPVLDGVRLGLWSVTDRGIAFVTIEPESDAIDFYDFGDQKVRRLGRLPFRVSRYAWACFTSTGTAAGHW